MQGTSLDLMTGKQSIITLTDDEISAIQSAAQQQPDPRITEIRTRLAQIDADSLRPLRAIANGTATQFDRDKLAALDAEADVLRLELSRL